MISFTRIIFKRDVIETVGNKILKFKTNHSTVKKINKQKSIHYLPNNGCAKKRKHEISK